MKTTVEDASNNNDGTEVSVFAHSLDGRLSRPTSAWKSQRRRPKFTSLDGDDHDLDLEVVELDDGDSSDDNADLVDLRNVVGQNRPNGNGRPFQSVTYRETELVVPHDWISKSSPRTPRAWQEGNDLAEFHAKVIRGPFVRRASGEASASECETNSSTDTLSSGRGRRNSYELKLSSAERRFDGRPRDFKELQNELAGHVCVGGRMVERYRAGEDVFPSRGGGDALVPVGQTHDVKYPTRPSVPRETKQLPYSHLRQKLRPIERRIEVPVEVDDEERNDVKSTRRNRLRPLMTKKARALFGHRQTDDKMGAYGSSCVTENVKATELVNGTYKRAIRGIVVLSKPDKAEETDARRLEVVAGELGGEEEVKVKPGIDSERLTSQSKPIETPVASEDALPTPRMPDNLFETKGSHKMERSTEAPNVSALNPQERTFSSLTISENQNYSQAVKSPVETDEVRRNSVDRSSAGSEIASSRDGIGIRPKFVGPECFENSATLSRSWKSPDSAYPTGAKQMPTSPGNLFYATHYSQFLPNDLNLEEFSLFDGEFTKSYRPSSPEPSDDILERSKIPDAAEALTVRGTAPTPAMPTLRVSAASSVAARPSEDDDYLAAPSPSIALSLSLSASMIVDDDQSATPRSGAASSRMNSDRRRLDSTTVPPSSCEALETSSMVQVVAPVEAPRMSREGPAISRSVARSVSFADEPIVVPEKQVEEWSVAEQSDLSPSARSLAPAPSQPPSASSVLSLVPSPPKLAPSRPAAVASPRPAVAASPRPTAPSEPTSASSALSLLPSPPKMAPSRPSVVASPRAVAVASPRAVAVTPTRQSSRVPSDTLSSTPSKVPSRIHFSPSETLSKVPLMTHFTPPEPMSPAPPKVPMRTQLLPSGTASLASAPSPLVPSYAPLKSEGLTFNNSSMYSPWGPQSLADMWTEAQKGLNQTTDKTSFL